MAVVVHHDVSVLRCRGLRHDLGNIRLVGVFDAVGWLKFGQRDQLVVRVAVTDVRRQFQVQGVRRLGLLQREHAVVQIQVPEENHVVDHEAEERTQFVLGREHELLSLVFNNGGHLLLDLTRLFKHEVRPRKLLLDAIVQRPVPTLVRVCVEHVHSEPARGVQLDDLQGIPTRGHRHPPSHELQLLALLLIEEMQVHGAQELLQLEWPVFREDKSVEEVKALQRLGVLAGVWARCRASLLAHG